MAKPAKEQDEKCGIRPCFQPGWLQKFATIKLFAVLMSLVIAVQGMYLGYIVGVQTSIEKRFEITNSQIGTLVALYDVGHTISVMLVGHFGSQGNKPRWTAIGVLCSALGMFGLSLPNFIYGPTSIIEQQEANHWLWSNKTQCNLERGQRLHDNHTVFYNEFCVDDTHEGAYWILAFSQLIAGFSTAPFNTLAYIYIDDNVSNRQSPMYLGILTSMYAFGPAFGFGLSAICNSFYADLTATTVQFSETNPNWVGAWWLGFLICGILYVLLGLPLFLFPKRMPNPNQIYQERYEIPEAQKLNAMEERHQENNHAENCRTMFDAVKELPFMVWNLLKNPVFTSMMLGWIFGSYLVGGYGTYLPKYLEHQYHITSSMSDIWAGIISIGSVATSTAVGGYLLTRFNIKPRRATLLLVITWSVIVLTELIGMALGCPEAKLAGKQLPDSRWNFTMECNYNCGCEVIQDYDPVCNPETGLTYFSACHAGCFLNGDSNTVEWINCSCANDVTLPEGSCEAQCNKFPMYMALMFVGLFVGNLFFMTTMMVILRCVYDAQKSLALSFASCLTNIFGFIPGPIIFGYIIDSSCMGWHDRCSNAGNCILYDNKDFRHKYHMTNAGFQLAAIAAVTFTYLRSRTFTFPEEEDFASEFSHVSNQANGGQRPVMTRTESSDTIDKALGVRSR